MAHSSAWVATAAGTRPLSQTNSQPSFPGAAPGHSPASSRQITISPQGEMAWFSESLRGTGGNTGVGSGVLVRTASGWLVAQYHISYSAMPGAMDYTAPAAVVVDGSAQKAGPVVNPAPTALGTGTSQRSLPKRDVEKCATRPIGHPAADAGAFYCRRMSVSPRWLNSMCLRKDIPSSISSVSSPGVIPACTSYKRIGPTLTLSSFAA